MKCIGQLFTWAAVLLLAAPIAARVQPSDFAYLGSFDLECDDDWQADGHLGCTYGQLGLSMADGGDALWVTGHAYNANVWKISIPPIGGDAELLGGPIVFPECPEDPHWYFSGIEEFDGEMLGTCKYWYNVSGNDYDIYYTSPSASPQHVGPRADPFHSSKVGAYLFEVPEDFATEHLGGRQLIGGFLRTNGAYGGSQGPTLMAFHEDYPGDALDLVWYRTIWPECTWEDYDTCDFEGYRAGDNYEGATWVRTASGDAIAVVGMKGLGETIYGEGPGRCSPYKGYHSDPYEQWILLYDPQDIVRRLAGELEPWEVQPYAHLTISGVGGIGTCASLGGVTFDQASGKLYVVNKSEAGYGVPRIHVWQLDADPPPDPVCGDGNCDPGEDPNNCPEDCGEPEPVCGDGLCEVGEDCPADCDPVCGDGVCEEGEECLTDCCPEAPACDSCCPTPEPCDSCCPTCPPLPPTLDCEPTHEWTVGPDDTMELMLRWDCAS